MFVRIKLQFTLDTTDKTHMGLFKAFCATMQITRFKCKPGTAHELLDKFVKGVHDVTTKLTISVRRSPKPPKVPAVITRVEERKLPLVDAELVDSTPLDFADYGEFHEIEEHNL